MTTAIRFLVGLGAIGSVAGGAYLLHQQLSTESIEKKLKANGYEILTNDKLNIWTEILNNYKERIDLQFNDFDGKNTAEGAEKLLQEKCKEIFKLNANNEAYKKGEKWCTVPKKLKELLENKGYKTLSTSDTDDEKDKKEWNEIINKHNQEKTDKKFEGLGADNEGKLKDDEKSRKEIKAKCKLLLEKFNYDKELEKFLEKSELWCVVKKDNS